MINLLIMRSEGLNNMLHYAWVFLVVALIAAFLGFGESLVRLRASRRFSL